MVLSLLDTIVSVQTDVFACWDGAQFQSYNMWLCLLVPSRRGDTTAGSPVSFQGRSSICKPRMKLEDLGQIGSTLAGLVSTLVCYFSDAPSFTQPFPHPARFSLKIIL